MAAIINAVAQNPWVRAWASPFTLEYSGKNVWSYRISFAYQIFGVGGTNIEVIV
jgi:hypothetical protein